MVVGPLWTARQKDCGQRPRSWGVFFAGQNCFGQTALNWQQTSMFAPFLELWKATQKCHRSEFRRVIINFVHQEMLERLQSIGHSFNALAHAITHILDQDLPHNPQGFHSGVTRFSGGCANMEVPGMACAYWSPLNANPFWWHVSDVVA